MNRTRLKAMIATLCMVLACAAAAAWRPGLNLADSRAPTDLATLFPAQLASWSVDAGQPAQLVSPDQAALLGRLYAQTLARSYINADGDRIMLSVAYGGDQSDATRAHRPEVCYPAQGFEILQSRRDTLAFDGSTLPVRQLVARQGPRIEPITYWIVVGERIATNGTEQKLAQLDYSLRGLIPDGMLVRVSTLDADTGRAFALEQQFLGELGRALPAALKSRVFGR